eukprot:Skav217136  [mRNA]  locus=scaffold1539:43874:46119:- [translate_table: standard]
MPEIKVEEWEPGDAGQPVAYSMERQLLTKYTHWARCLGVEEESLALPPWLRDSLEEQQPEPSFFSEPRAQKLTRYQKRAIRFGVRRGGKLLLADDMGLGKSVQALGVAWEYQTSFPMLIICPSLLRKLWQQQISKWTPIPTKDVQEISAGTTVLESAARAVIVAYEDLDKLIQLQNSKTGSAYKVLIADECHCIKTYESQISNLIRIASVAERMILVSSAAQMVLKNAGTELYPLVQILDPNVGNDGSFRERYFSNTTAGHLECNPRRELELSSYLFKIIGIRRKRDALLDELPAIRRQVIFLPNSSGELHMEREIFSQKKLQTSNSGRLSDMKRLSQLVMSTKRRSCVDYVKEIISHGIGKFLLFAYHRDMLDSLESALKETLGAAGYVRIDGRTSSHERENLIGCFEEDLGCQAALLSFTALSEGQTFSTAQAIVFTELAWAPGVLLQCEGRVNGGSVLIQYLLFENCQWDSRCYQRLEEKLLVTRQSAAWQDHATQVAARTGAPARLPVSPVAKPQQHRQVTQEVTKEVRRPKTVEPSSARPKKVEPSSVNVQSEVYKVVELLHLGLNLKLNQCYSRDALERKCQGNTYKLKRLHEYIKEAKKLHLVSAAFNSAGSNAQMIRTPKRQKLCESRWASSADQAEKSDWSSVPK